MEFSVVEFSCASPPIDVIILIILSIDLWLPFSANVAYFRGIRCCRCPLIVFSILLNFLPAVTRNSYNRNWLYGYHSRRLTRSFESRWPQVVTSVPFALPGNDACFHLLYYNFFKNRRESNTKNQESSGVGEVKYSGLKKNTIQRPHRIVMVLLRSF